jgi:hypothetical protein
MTDSPPDDHQASDTDPAAPDATRQLSTDNDSSIEENLSNGHSPSIPSSLSSDNPSKNTKSQAEAPTIAESTVAPATPEHQKAIREATELLYRVSELVFPKAENPHSQISPNSPDYARSLLLQAIHLLESQSGLSASRLCGKDRQEPQETADTEEHEEAEEMEIEKVQETAESEDDIEAQEREVAVLRAEKAKWENQAWEMRKNLPDESSGSEKDSEISE